MTTCSPLALYLTPNVLGPFVVSFFLVGGQKKLDPSRLFWGYGRASCNMLTAGAPAPAVMSPASPPFSGAQIVSPGGGAGSLSWEGSF